MKKLYINDILKNVDSEQEVEVLGWIAFKREHREMLFLDLVDSTGSIQIIVRREDASDDLFARAQGLTPESSVRIVGRISRSQKTGSIEIEARQIELIGDASLDISPRPRTHFDIFASKFADSTLKNRHLYLRNEKMMAALRVRHTLFGIVHHWFREQGFIEIHGPILAQVPLYDDKTAFSLDFFGSQVYLNQCVAFYLESAVHAFEKVYNIGPSFRAEESRSRRHLAEYWHVKAEIAFNDFQEIMDFAESMIAHIVKQIGTSSIDDLKILEAAIDADRLSSIPYPRITYQEAFEILSGAGLNLEWGESLGAEDIQVLSQRFSTPFWLTGIPRSVEPFPYEIDPIDPRTTKTADLIAPEGYGELLGIAEKIYDPDQLLARMKEKGRESDERYRWYYELRRYGSVPHSGLGMGVERVLRWLLKLNHVRNTIPFPRIFDRSPYP
jgi:asparaginyl-tRNA synthetase